MRFHRTLFAVGLCLAGNLALAQDAASVARHAPAGTTLALVTRDVAQACAAFERTRLGETLCGPDFKPLVDELRRRQLGGPLYLRPAVGFDWSDLKNAHEAGGLFVFPLADGKLGMAFVFQGAAPSAMPELLAAAERYFAAQKFRRSTARHPAAQLVVLTPAATDSKESPRVLFVAKEFYGIANSPQAAEAILATTAEKSLAAGELWQQAQAKAATTAAANSAEATVIVRPMELWELVRRDADGKKPPDKKPPQAAANQNAAKQKSAKQKTKGKAQPKDEKPPTDPLVSSRQTGFDGVKALAGRVTFAPAENLDWQLQCELIAPRPFGKALRMLEFKAGPLPELPDWIAADVTSASFWQWDFPLAIQGFGNLFDEANEPGPDGVGLFEDMLDGLRDDPEGVQVDLRKDIFAELGPEMVNLTDRKGSRTQELSGGERSLYIARVRDMGKVTGALTRFYRGDERVAHSEVGPYQVWTVPEGASLFVEGESDSVVSVRALAVGDGRMLFGTDEAMLKAALTAAASGPRLKDDPGWSRLWSLMRERHGQQGALWALSRLDEIMQPAYQQAVSGEKSEDEGLMPALWRVLLFGTADKEADVPVAAAPQFDRVRAALPPAGTVLIPTEHGFFLGSGALGGATTP